VRELWDLGERTFEGAVVAAALVRDVARAGGAFIAAAVFAAVLARFLGSGSSSDATFSLSSEVEI
jgi:hypothetical protein